MNENCFHRFLSGKLILKPGSWCWLDMALLKSTDQPTCYLFASPIFTNAPYRFPAAPTSNAIVPHSSFSGLF